MSFKKTVSSFSTEIVTFFKLSLFKFIVILFKIFNLPIYLFKLLFFDNGSNLKSELFFYHFGILLQFLSGYALKEIDKTGYHINTIFSIISIILYQIRRMPKTQFSLNSKWIEEVINPNINRFSTGIYIVFIDTLHITIFFFAAFIGISNIIYLIDNESMGNNLFKSWMEVFLYTLQSINLTKSREIANMKPILSLFLIINSLIGISFNAFWTALFMKSFANTLLKFKDSGNGQT